MKTMVMGLIMMVAFSANAEKLPSVEEVKSAQKNAFCLRRF
jgi:hypothetical protein